jgi:hypothetical protein
MPQHAVRKYGFNFTTLHFCNNHMRREAIVELMDHGRCARGVFCHNISIPVLRDGRLVQ